MKCPYCGGELNSDSSFCGYCGSQISLEMKREQEQLNKEGCPRCKSTNVTFNRENVGKKNTKKGTQNLYRTVGICRDCGYTWVAQQPKKSYLWLWIIGWILMFPIPLTILISRSRKMKKVWKGILIGLAWLLFLIMFSCSNSKEDGFGTEGSPAIVSNDMVSDDTASDDALGDTNTSDENVLSTAESDITTENTALENSSAENVSDAASSKESSSESETTAREGATQESAGRTTSESNGGLNGHSAGGQSTGNTANTSNQVGNAANQAAETASASMTPMTSNTASFDLASIPAYSSSPYAVVNGNKPYFADSEIVTTPFEKYSNLDSKGRCGVAYANICKELMPTEERGEIGMIKPSGWQTVKYPGIVDGNYLYNRCHLIGYQLAGENANEKNLITGTRYLNVEGMLPFENEVADYVERTGNHVLYRVTPIFEGSNLLASGVLMEAKSVEDNGAGVCFNVFCYNVQPGITINYVDGKSSQNAGATTSTEAVASAAPSTTSEIVAENAQAASTSATGTAQATPTPVITQEQAEQSDTTTVIIPEGTTYVLNTNTHKFHYSSCSSVSQMSERNRQCVTWTREECIANGYEPCGNCHP